MAGLGMDKETTRVQAAFEKGEKSISASNIIGHGWSNEGYGYETTTNNGISDTYAKVSIAEPYIIISAPRSRLSYIKQCIRIRKSIMIS